MKNQLTHIYLLVCQIYDNQCSLKYQRDSNFKPVFTGEELITVYLFGQLNEKFNQQQIHQFIREYWSDWFPDLPSYQAFNRRLNLLADSFESLFADLLQAAHHNRRASSADYLIDSMPIMFACGTRAKRARVALETAKTGFCATKQIHFHGVRVHLIGNRQAGALPTPVHIWLKEGNIHDLTALCERTDDLPSGINLFAGKACVDAAFKTELETRGINLLTPLRGLAYSAKAFQQNGFQFSTTHRKLFQMAD